ncbi:MAG: aconitate hydratase [Prevotellaceae bacterium]|nr:aconitate hydratase [Prevotellaceae bacterium]
MMYDFEMINRFYAAFPEKVDYARQKLGRPMTLAEKILYAHLYNAGEIKNFGRGEAYVNFRPDRVAMQDATAQMALLQFMNAGMQRSMTPASIHCDHLVQAFKGADDDLKTANITNSEVYDFLRSVAGKYGLDFWKAGSGIIHQIVFENYAFPGGMMVGTDSHTPNAGGMGMIAVGVGGADAVDVMSGMEWELKMPRLTGVRLTGRLSGWASAKDVILKLAGILTVKGGTDTIIEYFGDGVASLTATGKATICNMGAETGATTSVFPFDQNMAACLRATGRAPVAELCEQIDDYLRADSETLQSPEKFFDRIIEIDLSTLEPYINGPFSPDAATPISEFAAKVREQGYPQRVEAALIGSCTNSSYQDLSRVASILRNAQEEGIAVATPLTVNPGSELIRRTADAEGLTDDFTATGAVIMANACGPCIGQWKRITDDNTRRNSIVTSFNRNFAKRADGNPNTFAFVASPELTTAFAIAGDLCFNPLKDTLFAADGCRVKLREPEGSDFPAGGFVSVDEADVAPQGNIEIRIDPASERLQLLAPFPPANDDDLLDLRLLVKTEGKCTTDHISMAGSWLRYRGHLENISQNLLAGAVNAFNGKTDSVLNHLNGRYEAVSSVARQYRDAGIGSIVVAEDNYGEGSSREHAAMEPRFLNVKAILAKSFARIHETNLKKQGILPLTFACKDDYSRVREDDRICVADIHNLDSGQALSLVLIHADGTEETFPVKHTFNEIQIKWYRAGSALNYLKSQLLNQKKE